eukprot:TRINITY_DN41237_c0_g1_i1.p1 TRINITY_DN41237_c0_g1~~TRINITY_DN41237_c0_g1_i1.p1  ORF type:complete len:355 (-),score=65.28 TRINITY_DN41237_c0_g1_i1:25-1005(-)
MISAGLLEGLSEALNKVHKAVKDTVGDQPVQVKVENQTWTRRINVEVFRQHREETWCSERPSESYKLSAVRKKRGIREVEQRKATDGTLYSYAAFIDHYSPEKRQADNGQAYTYKQFLDYYGKDERGDLRWVTATTTSEPDSGNVADEEWSKAAKLECTGECCPNCHTESFEDFWCSFSIDRWTWSRAVTANGDNAYPYWPVVDVSECKEPILECERVGKHDNLFRVEFAMTDGPDKPSSKTHCDQGHMSQDVWQQLVIGKSYEAKKRLAWGLLCSSLNVPDQPLERRRAADGTLYTYAEFADFYREAVAEKWEAAPVEPRADTEL